MAAPHPLVSHPDRALPPDPVTREIAREVLRATEILPIISMHGHVDVTTFVDNAPFGDPAELFIRPDHYLTRMLGSQGISREELGLRREGPLPDPRATWRLFCQNWHLFRGTPTRYWTTDILTGIFGVTEAPSAESADRLFDHLSERLADPQYLPLALLDRFGIDLISTTDAADANLAGHKDLARGHGRGRVLPTLRPDALFAISSPAWREHLDALARVTGREVADLSSLVAALEQRRGDFIAAGGRATDHASTTADIGPMPAPDAARAFADALAGRATGEQEQSFVAHMLFEMARMSCDDGLTMQFHPGSLRDYDSATHATWGPDVGYDIPVALDFTRGVRPVLEAFGHHPRLRLVVFTLDEDTYSRELAPLAGAFPALVLGAPWWFLDSPGGMRRFREAVTETAGFYNTAGFVDDTRAFCSIPTRHDLARRIDAGHLAGLVAEHHLGLDEAIETAVHLVDTLPRRTYPEVGA